jgi:hypothetical protein
VRERLTRAGLTADLRVVQGAPHLFTGRATDAAAEVLAAAEALLGS